MAKAQSRQPLRTSFCSSHFPTSIKGLAMLYILCIIMGVGIGWWLKDTWDLFKD